MEEREGREMKIKMMFFCFGAGSSAFHIFTLHFSNKTPSLLRYFIGSSLLYNPICILIVFTKMPLAFSAFSSLLDFPVS